MKSINNYNKPQLILVNNSSSSPTSNNNNKWSSPSAFISPTSWQTRHKMIKRQTTGKAETPE